MHITTGSSATSNFVWLRKHKSEMSVKKKKDFQQQCIYFFSPQAAGCSKKQKAPATLIYYYSTQSVQLRQMELDLSSSKSKHKNSSEKKNKTKKVVQCCCLKIQCSVSGLSIYWSQISALHETEATWGGGHLGGSWCWWGNVWHRILCRNWQECTCTDIKTEREEDEVKQHQIIRINICWRFHIKQQSSFNHKSIAPSHFSLSDLSALSCSRNWSQIVVSTNHLRAQSLKPQLPSLKMIKHNFSV